MAGEMVDELRVMFDERIAEALAFGLPARMVGVVEALVVGNVQVVAAHSLRR